ncbi:hypothetical protein D499_0C01970 [Hanseniaspora uvarum DSM 2768]|nr:hypothetical protein D499_0C01970 [Hanseniaspora uvarum DSM 2768]
MQIKNVVAAATLSSIALAETTTTKASTTTLGPSAWTTLTPNATFSLGLSTEASTFGIGIAPITTGSIWDKYHPTTTGTSTISNPTSATESAVSEATAVNQDPFYAVACKAPGVLNITLEDGILKDSHDRIGSIVANRQFQFDGPTPQAGAIYAGGWSISPEGNLVLGEDDIFFQCLSGNFYNIYDEYVAEQCYPVNLQVLEYVDC